jgi:hypothetical protein
MSVHRQRLVKVAYKVIHVNVDSEMKALPTRKPSIQKSDPTVRIEDVKPSTLIIDISPCVNVVYSELATLSSSSG